VSPRPFRGPRARGSPAAATDPLAGVRAGYDRWAAVYDTDRNPLPALEEPRVRRAMGAVRGLDVLDLGCGTGRHALWLARRGAHVTAVDFSEGMLAEARRKRDAAKLRFLVHDLHRPLPFPERAFDLVVSGLVLEHIRNLTRFFAEARRVLRPGGRAVISAMHPAMFLRGTQARFPDPVTGRKVRPGSLPHRIEDFERAARRAGFILEARGEYAPDARFARRFPRAAKYVGWPMLVVLELRAGGVRAGRRAGIRSAGGPASRPRARPDASSPSALWTCPKCGARLVGRNMWHSCGQATVEEWKAQMGPAARRRYDRFEAMVAACGPYHVAPAKTRIAFLARVRFAGLSAISDRGMTCAFALPAPLRSTRFTKVEEIVPGWWGHRLRITDDRQLDAQLQGWLRRSYRLMGLQERLKAPHPHA
jgi:SAM-dependent methyltransferase